MKSNLRTRCTETFANARWVILVLNVRELNWSVMSKRMMILRLTDWIEQQVCFAFKSATVLRWIRRELPSSSKRVSDRSEEPAGTHEEFDQSTGEVLFAVGCRDDRPINDSGSVPVHVSSGLCDVGSDRKYSTG